MHLLVNQQSLTYVSVKHPSCQIWCINHRLRLTLAQSAIDKDKAGLDSLLDFDDIWSTACLLGIYPWAGTVFLLMPIALSSSGRETIAAPPWAYLWVRSHLEPTTQKRAKDNRNSSRFLARMMTLYPTQLPALILALAISATVAVPNLPPRTCTIYNVGYPGRIATCNTPPNVYTCYGTCTGPFVTGTGCRPPRTANSSPQIGLTKQVCDVSFDWDGHSTYTCQSSQGQFECSGYSGGATCYDCVNTGNYLKPGPNWAWGVCQTIKGRSWRNYSFPQMKSPKK